MSAVPGPLSPAGRVEARQPIRVLPPEVAERIAAGEVIERPASVVKELVENALDAGATSVRVELRGGGLQLIRVVDDGCGIPAEEVELAFRRHATSKLRSAEELEEVRTLGFRGEALPSIAAVAEVTMHTQARESGMATRVTFRGGRLESRDHAPRARGTTVSVRGLFAPVPARLKFVRSPRHEAALVGLLLRRYAVGFPAVQFTLLIEGRVAFRSGGGGDPTAALAEAYGAVVAEALRPVGPLPVGEAGRLWGQISGRELTRADRQHITVFVNRRWVQPRLLLSWLEAAYRPFLPRGRHPVAVLHLELPPGSVDVNVHPAKTDLRIREEAPLRQALAEAARRALATSPTEPRLRSEEALAPPGGYALPLATGRRLAERRGPPGGSPTWPVDGHPVGEDAARAWPEGAPWSSAAGATAGRRPAPPGPDLPRLRYLGRAAEALLLAEGAGGLYLVDQHRAHERVIYERLRAGRTSDAQLLLEPILLEVKPAQVAALAGRLDELAALGLACEQFGGRHFLVRSLPAALREGDWLAALAELVEEAGAGEGDWQDRLVVALACRAAVRKGQPLTDEQAEDLLAQLARTSAPAVCPHGSPVVVLLSGPFLARQFNWR